MRTYINYISYTHTYRHIISKYMHVCMYVSSHVVIYAFNKFVKGKFIKMM